MSNKQLRMPNGEADTGQYMRHRENFRKRMAEYKQKVKQDPNPVFLGRVAAQQ